MRAIICSAVASLSNRHDASRPEIFVRNAAGTLQDTNDGYQGHFCMGASSHWGDRKLNGRQDCKENDQNFKYLNKCQY